jgi:ubiquinone/menaquinone biosynthesis C-methylase UbiE
MSKKILDFGCGNKKIKNSVGIDFNSSTQADIVHDLNIFPYPIDENIFDEIYCRHILEHLPDLLSVMKELHRVAKPGALIFVESPYWSSHRAYKDPTHVRFFTENTFDYFTNEYSMNFYTDVRVIVEKVELEISSNIFARISSKILPISFLKLFNNLISNVKFVLRVVK